MVDSEVLVCNWITEGIKMCSYLPKVTQMTSDGRGIQTHVHRTESACYY